MRIKRIGKWMDGWILDSFSRPRANISSHFRFDSAAKLWCVPNEVSQVIQYGERISLMIMHEPLHRVTICRAAVRQNNHKRELGRLINATEIKQSSVEDAGRASKEQQERQSARSAYKEKMKEISVFSLICSCLYPDSRKKTLGDFEELDIKPINKRASGQAFEILLKPTSPVSDAANCVTSPPKRDISLDDIQKKLEAAEDRRRSQEAQVLQALAEKREHERDVLLKAMEENSNFSRMAEEKLQLKMEQIQENRQAYLDALMERLQQRERHAQEVRRNKEMREEVTA